jgi:hypothetical protein
MDRLAYLAAMALLGIGLTMAQNSKPNPAPGNSSNSSVQAQSSTSTSSEQPPAKVPRHHQTTADSQSNVPDTTVQDQQGSATSSTTGTSGSATAPDSTDQANKSATIPQNSAPVDQQPNSLTGPSPAAPHTALTQGPAARAAATHTPDPGTCMNPAALQAGEVNGQTNTSSPCR